MKKNIYQKKISQIEFYKMFNYNIILNDIPINRYTQKISSSSLSKNEQLIELKEKIKKIKNCKIKESSKNIVFSDGNVNSRIMLIGEGPSVDEHKKGLPFIGESGKLLDKMIHAINLDRSKVYLINLLNYLTPDNRKPTNEEINRYLPFLKTHIQIIDPKIIVLLGSSPLQALFGNEKIITKERGKWLKILIGSSIIDVIASFHPNFLIKQPELKKMSWNDLKLIRDKINVLRI